MKANLKVTDSDFEKEVILSKTPVFIDFWASWCIPSQMMMPLVDTLHKKYKNRIKIRVCNIDQNPGVRERLKILGCPTFILFKGGQETARKVGAQSAAQLEELIVSAL